MANEQLREYVQKARTSGMSDWQIKIDLLKAGWDEGHIMGELMNPTVVSEGIGYGSDLIGVSALLKESLALVFRNFLTVVVVLAVPLVFGVVTFFLFLNRDANIVFYVCSIVGYILYILSSLLFFPALVLSIEKK